MTAFRLPTGGYVDRSRPLSFSFNGRKYSGCHGDTLASALLANGIKVVGRSFKYHRPRGILTAGVEEPNAIVQLEKGAYTQPNLRATQIELYEGLDASSVNAWPSVNFDLGATTKLFGRMLVAGFYYKTFMWPRRFWHSVYEPAIRKLAGLGVAPAFADPDFYDKTYAHTDVLVIGAGPAGLAAALAAANTSARVMLVEQDTKIGGYLLSNSEMVADRTAREWINSAVAKLASFPDATVLRRTTAFGCYDHNYVLLVERRTDHLPPGSVSAARQRLWHVRAKKVILATGAHERPLVFPNNDRPGIMLAGAASEYLVRYGVSAGKSVVVCTNNDSAYGTALQLSEAGVHVEAIVDSRAGSEGWRVSAASSRGLRIIFSSTISDTSGRNAISAVSVTRVDEANRRSSTINCDLLAVSGGWSPVVHLWSQAQGPIRWDEASACFVPAKSLPHICCIGAANGTFDLYECVNAGLTAGAAAAVSLNFDPGKPLQRCENEQRVEGAIESVWHPGKKTRKMFVDFQHDVTVQDLQLAAREGLESVEHVKRYTTTGMATDQGKTSNVNAIEVLSQILGKPVPQVGVTTFRPPYSPVTTGALAGRERGALMDPVRTTPMHTWHVSRGAIFEEVGQWKRPWYYPTGTEDLHTAVLRETRVVRTAVGMQDVSTLGKIDIKGPDAAEFLDRVYTNSFRKLGINRCRYGIMCRDDGMVFDDGVTTRLADDHYFMTTTTGGAARVLDWLEELLQTDWLNLKVFLTSITEQYAGIVVAGPFARKLLSDLTSSFALDNESFPFLSMREGRVAGFPARVFRISFSGELAYEINVSADLGLALWDAIFSSGQKFGITPYGTETMHVLRAEKGFIIVGQETDGTVTPIDLGMDWIVSKQKEFIGRRALRRPDMVRADRKQLVGLLPIDTKDVIPEGAQLIETPGFSSQSARAKTASIGHVTSSYWSPNLERSFALALVSGGRARIGTSASVPTETCVVRVEIVDPVFVDKEGARQNA
jgi:sarcosine oxidase subunit alpha